MAFTSTLWLRKALDLPRDVIHRDGAPYMERYFLVNSEGRDAGGFTVRFHHLLTSDPDDPHDHPWDFMSLILDGRYIEHTSSGAILREPGDLITHTAADVHRITLPDGPVWTYVVTGGYKRPWGFHTAVGWVPWREYVDAGD